MSPSGEQPAPLGLFDMPAAATSVVDGLNDVVVVADRGGRVLYASPSVERVLGWHPADLRGEPVTRLVPERFSTAHLAGFERLLATGHGRTLGHPIRVAALTPAGLEHPVELVLSPLTLPDGSPVVAATMRDVAHRVDLERQSSLASELLDVFTRELSTPQLVEESIAALGRVLEMPAAAFWAPEPSGAHLRCHAFWRQPGEAAAVEAATAALRLRPGEGLAGRVWASRESAWVSALVEDPGFVRRPEALIDGLQSGLAFPVRARREVLGVIELFTATPTDPDASLLELVAVVGARLGELLYSARLEEERRLLAERETAVAAAFRESLLPEVVPEIPALEVGTAFSPGGAGVVGGDFYDVYPLAPIGRTRRWGFTVGDVCGTGPQAAAVTSKVRYTARALMRAGLELVAVGEHINTAMSSRKGRRFCTCIIGTIEQTGERVQLRFVNAGHPPPLVVRAGGAIDPVPPSGSLLGALANVDLVEQQVDLGSGDVVVLYTDGVTEARRDGELFGEARLAELVAGLGPTPAQDVAVSVQQAVQGYAGNALSDDVAILVLRRPPAR